MKTTQLVDRHFDSMTLRVQSELLAVPVAHLLLHARGTRNERVLDDMRQFVLGWVGLLVSVLAQTDQIRVFAEEVPEQLKEGHLNGVDLEDGILALFWYKNLGTKSVREMLRNDISDDVVNSQHLLDHGQCLRDLLGLGDVIKLKPNQQRVDR